jgi:hypothetical protein
MFNAGRQVGGAIGVAVLSTVISTVGVVHVVAGRPQSNARAYHLAFLTAAGIAIVAALLSTRISDTDAEPSMRRIAGHGDGSDEQEMSFASA